MAEDRSEPTEAEVAAYIRRDNAEADKHAAEAEQALQSARKEAIAADRAQIDLDREQHKRKLELAADTFHHVYLFDKQVDEGSVKACVTQLTQWVRGAGDESLTIELIINSPGGSIADGFALIDYIDTMHAQGHTVNTTAYGWAASMGGVLLQVGKCRSMGRNSVLLLHEGSMGAVGDFGKVEDRMKLMELYHGRILDIFEYRAKPINPRSTAKWIRSQWTRKDWWMTADEAVKLGFADRLADEA